MNALLWSVVIAGFAVAGGVIAWSVIPRRQRLKRFENRPELSLDQVYGEFFAGKNLPKDLTCELWKEVAESFDLPGGKLRPTDRFDLELADSKGWEFDGDSVGIQLAADCRLKRSGSNADLSQVKTVADYVEFFCNLAVQKPRP